MANHFVIDNKIFNVGDTISFSHKIKEGNKERKQIFKGIIIKIRGDSLANRMVTVRKMTRSGIGVEKIIPLASPLISDFKLIKKGRVRRSKIYFIRNLSSKNLTQKLYRQKK